MNVIIVEDNKVLSLLLCKMIERIGLKILDVISTGNEAIDKITQLQPDLIFMDIMLEDDISGIDVMEILRNQNINTPVIYITGNSDPYNREKAAKTCYTAFLTKPITFDELAQSVSKVFSST